jgi:transposase
MSSHEIVGIDVAARKLVATGERVVLAAAYENTPTGRSRLIKALCRSPLPVRVVLEATGIYFLDLACELTAAGIAVMVANPKPAPGSEQGATHHFAEAILQRRKNDPVDAAMLREFGRRMDFVPWQPPRHELFAFRALTREAQALSKTVAAAKNRLHAITATNLAPDTLIRALERQIAHNQALIDELVAAALAESETDPELARLVARTDSAPGFAAKAAVLVVGELAVLPPMTARQWVAQAGLDIREECSGTSLARRPRLSKRGNKRLREALFYPALTAARCCPAAGAFVDRLVAAGKTRLQAIVALMRKLLHGLHAMWRNDEDFNAQKLFAPA